MTSQKPNQDTPTQDKANVEGLQGFLEREHSPELDELKKSLSDGVGIMNKIVTIEIMDEESGIPLFIFAQGEDSAILNKKEAILDKDKRRASRDFQEWLEKFANIANGVFEKFSAIISQRIESIKTNAETEIKNIEAVLSAAPIKAAFGKDNDAGSAFRTRKNRLKDFVKRLSAHGENLESAESTEELIEIETKMEEDVAVFNKKAEATNKSNRTTAFFASLYASAQIIPEAARVVEEDPYDIFEELDVTASDDDDEGESGTSDTIEEELAY